MNYKDFISSVKRWKFAGAYLWSAILYLAYIIVLLFAALIFETDISVFSLFCGFPALALDIFLYFKSLTVIPVPNSVLTFSKFLFRFLWFFSHILFTFFVAFSLIGLIPSLCFSFISSYFLVATVQFSVQVPQYVFTNTERLDRIDILTKTYLFPKVPVIFLTFTIFLLNGCFSLFFYAFIPHFVISEIICRICEIIGGEPISFASKDEKRLANGLSSNDELVKFWAFTDLFLSSIDMSTQGRSIIFHSSGKFLDEIFKSLSRFFKTFSNGYFNIYDEVDPSHYSLTRLYDGTLNKDQRRKIVNNIKTRRAERDKEISLDANQQRELLKDALSLKTKILNALGISYVRMRVKETYRYYRSRSFRRISQAKATKDGIEAIEAIRALDSLIEVANEEDAYGVLQEKFEDILDMLLTVSRATKNSMHTLWVNESFEGPVKRYNYSYIIKSQEMLTIRVYETVSEVLQKIINKYKKEINYGKISEENIEELVIYT